MPRTGIRLAQVLLLQASVLCLISGCGTNDASTAGSSTSTQDIRDFIESNPDYASETTGGPGRQPAAGELKNKPSPSGEANGEPGEANGEPGDAKRETAEQILDLGN
ncbi:hypothetical protein K239x_42660 [Planctomycetes bacterium K23_9]|uniref:Uncharacterized protein n=1 Tax=Stieleria marina TaxID=1930275 RepID=A0A517NYQ0_9BACT|nr:hypothetical protein K239x_42660 [Planctomycetes bacterium K23_9]